MSGRWDKGRSRTAAALLALLAIVACVASVAGYAAVRPDGRQSNGGQDRKPARAQVQRPPRPRFIEVPPASGVATDVQFRFHIAAAAQPPTGRAAPGKPAPPPTRWRRFQCRLDGGDWNPCSSPYVFTDLEPADHSLAVRALSRSGRPGLASHYGWSQLEPRNFTIESKGGPAEDLMPGGAPQQLPIRIGNPNSAPIEVTSLTAAVAPDPPGCAGPNFAIFPSSVSSAAPLRVPAEGSVDLPNAAATAPAIALRELPTDQNACQGATVSLVFSGEARG